MRKISLLILASLTAFLFGCQTPEYYQEEAVIKARKYLLKHAPDLTLEESAFVKYNRPAIVHQEIFSHANSYGSAKINSDIAQIAIVWNIPGREESFMVWGAASESLFDFYPERLIRKKIVPKNLARAFAVSVAQKLILDNLYNELSVEEYNFIRYAEPEIYLTNFEFDKSAEKENLNDPNLIQISFVWTLRNATQKAIVAGEAYKNLADFQVYATGVFDNKDFEEHTIETYNAYREKEAELAKLKKQKELEAKKITAEKLATEEAAAQNPPTPATATTPEVKEEIPDSEKTLAPSPDSEAELPEPLITDSDNTLVAEDTPKTIEVKATEAVTISAVPVENLVESQTTKEISK